MENNATLIGSLIERAADYSKSGFELIKLKTLDKTSDVVSSLIPHSIVFVLAASFMLFLNLGLAFWLGEILGKMYYGFFVVAGFYCLTGIILHLFVHKWLKKVIGNYIIKQVLN